MHTPKDEEHTDTKRRYVVRHVGHIH